MNMEKYSASIIVVTTCVSIIFMLNMKISDTSAWMTLPEKVESVEQVQDVNISNNLVSPVQLPNEEMPKNGENDYESIKNVISPSEETDTSIEFDDMDRFLNEVEIHKPSWEEVKKRVEDKNVEGKSIQNLDISLTELDGMIKNLSVNDKIECISILSKLRTEDIILILKLYGDGVTFDEEKTARDILQNALTAEDYKRIMNIAEKSYIRHRTPAEPEQ
ncbi:MAG: hypothetical protein QME46_09580 [Thermoanaerobacteraceae bacterium]|nr:hypothetical protein [Thermoanaerobacteraceae bacterium]